MAVVKKYFYRSIFIFLFLSGFPGFGQELKYPWPHKSMQTIESRIAPPENFVRVSVAPGSFQDWLRHLPLKPGKPDVLLYNGGPRPDQSAHVAVIDMDVGNGDLQQCADSVIRLRAEYFYSRKDYKNIHFNFTSGDEASFEKYAQGYRPLVAGNFVRWFNIAPKDYSYAGFRNYLTLVFRYAGTYSLSQEMAPVKNPEKMMIGDVFIRGGFPGHVVMVVDMAENPKTGQKVFLLAQGYSPAVEMMVLENRINGKLSPWYSTKINDILITPQYNFKREELRRFIGPH